jgi:hypothetical protein
MNRAAKEVFLFLCVFLFFSLQSVRADEDGRGGDISYRYLGNDSMEVTIHILNTCDNDNLSDDYTLNVVSDCTGPGQLNLSFNNYMGLPKDITPICKSSCHACDPSSKCPPGTYGRGILGFGVIQFTYKNRFSLKNSQCCDYTFYTEFEPTGFGSTPVRVQAHFNKCKAGYHSSPVFDSEPLIVACTKKCISSLQSVKTGNNDSVRYTLDTLRYYSGQPYIYGKGYSPTYPFKTDSTRTTCLGFNYDAGTGTLNFKGIATGYFPFAVKATQYEIDTNGRYVAVGDIGRVMCLQMMNCEDIGDTPNRMPLIISGINESKSNTTIHGCTGTPLDFNVEITSGSNVDSITILPKDTALSGMTYSYSDFNTTDVRVNFEWTPPANALRGRPYIFDIVARDEHCIIPNDTSRRFYIYITDSFPKVHIIKKRLGCETYTISAPEDSTWKMQYAWQVGKSIVSTSKSFTDTFVKDGVYPLYLTLTNRSGCTKTLRDTIGVKLLPPLKVPHDTAICQGSSVILHAGGAQSYAWAPAKGLSTNTGDSVTAAPDTSTTYYVAGRDIYGCIAVDTVHVKVIGSELPKHLGANICKGDIAHFRLNLGKSYTAQWFDAKGNLLSDSSYYNQQYFKDEQLKYVVTNKQFNCKTDGSATIHIINARTTAGPDVSVCNGDSVQLHASGGKSYAWFADFGLLKNLYSPTPYVHPKKDMQYVVQITDSLGCNTTDTVKVFISNMTVKVDTRNDTICRGESVLLHASGGNHYEWIPSIGLNDASIANPVASPTVSTTYYVKVCDSLCGCVKHDSVHIQVNTVPKANAGGDKKLCRGESVRLGSNAVAGIKYHWQSMPTGFVSDSALVNIKPDSSGTYILTLSNPGTKCTSTDTARVIVYQRSKSKIYGTDSLCNRDTTYLSVTKAAGYAYHWSASGANIIGRTDSSAVGISINSRTATVSVLQTSANGCTDTAQKQIRNLGKPTGFTFQRSCAGSPVIFTDTAKGDKIAAYNWSFGDRAKANSTSNKASHTYANAGNYLVSVTAKDQSGCSNSASRVINIPPKPKADWSVRRINDSTYNFTAKDSLEPTYEWDFGDNGTSSINRDRHTYHKPGKYTIGLILLDSAGCEAKKDSVVTIDNIIHQDTLSIDTTKQDSVGIAPNPFVNNITVDYKLSKTSIVTILFYDELGQMLYSYNESGLPAGQYKVIIPAGAHVPANAMYFLKIVINNQVIVKRLLKLRG